MTLSRRQFTSLLGLTTLSGYTEVAHALSQRRTTISRKKESSDEKTEESKSSQETSAVSEADLISYERLWIDLLAGNKRFVSGTPQAREFIKTRQELAEGQHPRVIVLGCADSRVSPELVFDKNLGELFVVRTAGNIADPIALGSIEYAVEHLHSSLLVVLGHEKCGAVGAAAAGGKLPTANLEAIVKKITPALKPLQQGGATGDLLTSLGVEANVRLSVRDLVKNSPILRHELDAGKLMIIPAVYRLASGEVNRIG
jgi:carbonic anhydrase